VSKELVVQYKEVSSLQSRLESTRQTKDQILALCVKGGVEHADKMATVSAVKALVEDNGRLYGAVCAFAGRLAEKTGCYVEYGRDGSWQIRDVEKEEPLSVVPIGRERTYVDSVLLWVNVLSNLTILGLLAFGKW